MTPSDRVSSHLNVRSGPGTDNPVISKLVPDDSADLLDEVPYWYQVRLGSGDEGFVSKAWATVIPTDTLLRLGAWNIKKLGHSNDKDFATVAQIIEDHFDILAVVEVMQKQRDHPGYDDLMATLSEGWAGMVTATPRPRTGSGNSEFYAVVYRKDRVRPCEGWDTLRYQVDNDGSDTGQGPDHFSREPAYGCFASPVDGAIGVDFLLGAYHARWAGGDTSAIQGEAEQLDAVFDAMGAARPGEGDLWIVGDFNLVPADLAEIFQSGDRTQGSGSTLNTQGELTDNLYDHVLVHDEAASDELVGNAHVLDARDSVDTPKEFYDRVSDHLPIVISVQAGGPDDD
ncbi:MAG: SH3 domain-containing protein [Candidatus Desulfacyla sp.]